MLLFAGCLHCGFLDVRSRRAVFLVTHLLPTSFVMISHCVFDILLLLSLLLLLLLYIYIYIYIYIYYYIIFEYFDPPKGNGALARSQREKDFARRGGAPPQQRKSDVSDVSFDTLTLVCFIVLSIIYLSLIRRPRERTTSWQSIQRLCSPNRHVLTPQLL